MKFVLSVAVLLVSVNLSLQLAKLENCASDYVAPSSIAESCGAYTCDGISISGVGCPAYQCSPDTQTGYTEPDNSKMYPDCCGGPICGQ